MFCSQALGIVCAIQWTTGSFSAKPDPNDNDTERQKHAEALFSSVRGSLSSGSSPVSDFVGSSDSKDDESFSGGLQGLEIAPKVNSEVYIPYTGCCNIVVCTGFRHCRPM